MSPAETFALDMDVLVHWAMAGAEHHDYVRRWVDEGIQRGPTVRIDAPGPLRIRPRGYGSATVRATLSVPAAVRVAARVGVVPRVCGLFEALKLGRKRVLDTALVATIEAAGIATLATFNAKEFSVFGFLRVEEPSSRSAEPASFE